MTQPVHVVRDSVGIAEVLGRCRLGAICKLEHATKTEAVKAVRLRVFGDAGYVCHDCGALVTWDSGHLHEVETRGQGGNVSVSNSVCLCADCHLNGRHGNRKPQWSGRQQKDLTLPENSIG